MNSISCYRTRKRYPRDWQADFLLTNTGFFSSFSVKTDANAEHVVELERDGSFSAMFAAKYNETIGFYRDFFSVRSRFVKRKQKGKYLNFYHADCSGRITLEEFRTAIRSLKIGVTMDDEIKRLFQQFDTTQNGQIDLKEFLQQLRPPMSSRRERAAINVFNTMDSNQDGRLTVADLKVNREKNSIRNVVFCFFSSSRQNS